MKRRVLVALLALAMMATMMAGSALASTAPTESGDEASFQKEGPYVVAFSAVHAGNTWAAQAMHEVEYAMKNSPDVKEYYITDAENNGAKQVADIEDLLTKGIDMLVLQPINAAALTPVIEEAYNRGVVVVSCASMLDTDKYSAVLVSDETEFGRKGAEWLVEQLGGKGKVIILDGMVGIDTAVQRKAGAMSVFDQYPDIEIVAEDFGEWDYAKGKMITENMLAANPQIDGVWSSGGDMTRGAIEAFVAAKRPLIPMTGEDGNGFLKLWKQYKDDPGFDSIATTMPAWIYAEGFETGLRVLKGEPYEKDVKFEVATFTVDNLDDYVREDLNDSFWANSRLSKEAKQELYGL